MEKIKVTYVNLECQVLFNEMKDYLKIPRSGTFVVWHVCMWEVLSVIEDWDNKFVIVVFKFIKKAGD